MATTKIWKVEKRLDHVMDYTTNEEKTKNDYLETQINEIGKKYPNLCTFANYYIGLAENAISYVRMANLLEDDAPLSICHKRIEPEGTLFELYNPIGFVCDYRVRDVSEYVKKAFFEKMDAKEIVNEFFANNYISYKEVLLFYGRLLYPSYFFDIQGKIINENTDERKIEEVVSMSDEYCQDGFSNETVNTLRTIRIHRDFRAGRS